MLEKFNLEYNQSCTGHYNDPSVSFNIFKKQTNQHTITGHIQQIHFRNSPKSKRYFCRPNTTLELVRRPAPLASRFYIVGKSAKPAAVQDKTAIILIMTPGPYVIKYHVPCTCLYHVKYMLLKIKHTHTHR